MRVLEEIKEIKEKHLFSAAILKFVVGSIKVEQFFEHGRNPVLIPHTTDQRDQPDQPDIGIVRKEPSHGQEGSNPQPELKYESPLLTQQKMVSWKWSRKY